MVSSKLLGVGLLSVGCLAAAAGGGYLALRPTMPKPTQADAIKVEPMAAVPVGATVADTPVVVQAETKPAAAPPQPAPVPVSKTTTRPATKAAGEPVRSIPPASVPVDTPPVAAPPVETPAAPPVPVVTETPRYVPDVPSPAAAVVAETQRFDLEELTVEKHSVIGIRLDTTISTRTARVEDRVSATVSRDVTVGARTAIPAGVRLEGTVALVERGDKFRNRSRIGLRFDRMILADGTRVAIQTDTIFREGDSPSTDATAKVGAAAVAGAILGAVIGGKKGAAIGTAAGAVGGAAAVMKSDAGETTLPAGAPLTVRLADAVTVTIRK